MQAAKLAQAPSRDDDAPRDRGHIWQSVLIVLAAVVYFLAMSWDRLSYRFAADEMMNMGFYFRPGPWRVLASQFLIWKNYYRPMGGAFYLPLFTWFGLNPRPFQLAATLILAFNIVLLFCLARRLGCSRAAAGIALALGCYHAGLANLLFNTDMIYDVLCFTFYVGALVYYIGIRRSGRTLRGWEVAVFLLLYLCALNSKEMALTLPGVVFAYEWFFHRPKLPGFGATIGWIRGAGLGVLAVAVLDLVDLYGKMVGGDAIMSYDSYHPVFTFSRFLDFQKGSLHDLLGQFFYPRETGIAVVWLLVTYLAWRRPRPVLRFCWAYMLLTPIPIMFLVGRFQGALYIPMAGWVIFAAIVLLDVAGAVSRFLAEEPGFRLLGPNALLVLLISGALLFWSQHMRHIRNVVIKPAAATEGLLQANVIEQLRALHPQVPPKSRVVFLNDPFVDWDMTFIGMLYFHDRSIEIYTQRKQPLPPNELAQAPFVFDFQNGKMVRVR